jgi:hypothetical protein
VVSVHGFRVRTARNSWESSPPAPRAAPSLRNGPLLA